MDDLFDILGISIFASGGKWSPADGTPPIPFSERERRRESGETCDPGGDPLTGSDSGDRDETDEDP